MSYAPSIPEQIYLGQSAHHYLMEEYWAGMPGRLATLDYFLTDNLRQFKNQFCNLGDHPQAPNQKQHSEKKAVAVFQYCGAEALEQSSEAPTPARQHQRYTNFAALT